MLRLVKLLGREEWRVPGDWSTTDAVAQMEYPQQEPESLPVTRLLTYSSLFRGSVRPGKSLNK